MRMNGHRPAFRLKSRDARAFLVHALNLHDIKKPGACVPLRKDGKDLVGMTVTCPCGCGERSMIFFRGRGPDPKIAPEWDLTRDWPNISLTPEIGFRPMRPDGSYHWLGELMNGYFMEFA